MQLPVYQTITLQAISQSELQHLLSAEINLRHPVILDLKALTLEEQRELIGHIENFFVTSAVSYKFPYPVYVLTDHESTISGLSLIKSTDVLPKFYFQKEGKINVKESQLLVKNRLLQQEVRNGDSISNETEIKVYGKIHRQLAHLEEERVFYRSLLNRLNKGRQNG